MEIRRRQETLYLLVDGVEHMFAPGRVKLREGIIKEAQRQARKAAARAAKR